MLVNNLSRKHKREKSAKPPLAVVGSQISYDEEMFGAAFDGIVIRRFWEFVKPYKRMLYLGIGAVLLFTLSQVAIPLLLRLIIDDALVLETNAQGQYSSSPCTTCTVREALRSPLRSLQH